MNGTLRTATVLDYELGSTLSILVEVRDEFNATAEGNFTVTLIDDVYEDSDGDQFSDAEELSAGTDPFDPASKPGLNFGLVAWYPFDGNASDMSGNGNDGTVYGATLGEDRNGEAGKAYEFDGDDWIESTNVVSKYNNLTFSAWFSAQFTTTGTSGIVSKPRSTNGGGSRLGYSYQEKALHIGFNYPH